MSGVVWAQNPLAEAIARNNWASVLADEGRFEEAEGLYRAALGARYDDDLTRAKIAHNLALLYQRQDRYQDAERWLRRVLQWRQEGLPAGSIEIAYSLNNLAEIYHVEGRDWEARNLLEAAVRSLHEFHPDAPNLALILSNLAAVRCRFKEFEEAEALLREASLLYEKQQGTASRDYGITWNNLGRVFQSRNQIEEAGASYEQAIHIFEQLGPKGRSSLATALANIGTLYEQQNRIADAKRAEQRALELLRPTGDELLRATILRNLGKILAGAGNAADSLPYFEEALRIQDKTLGSEYPASAGLLLDYASATLRAGDKSRYRKLQKRAQELAARLNHQSPEELTVAVQALRSAK